MNEPHRGYIQLHDMYSFDPNTDLQLGYHASAIESFALGDGYEQLIPYYKPSFPHPTTISHYVLANPEKERAWNDDAKCIWREHGVWEWDEKHQKPAVLRQTYFEKDPRTGEPFEWYKECWYPFVKKFSARVRKGANARRKWMTFAAGIPNEVSIFRQFDFGRKLTYLYKFTPPWRQEDQPENFISAPHFYDLHSLFTKVRYNSQNTPLELTVLTSHLGISRSTCKASLGKVCTFFWRCKV